MASVIKAGNATDGVQVTSDNTGILELKTGTGSGTTAMTVDTSQNVGIGTSSPNAKLQVVAGAGAAVQATANAGQPQFYGTDGTAALGLYANNSTGNQIYWGGNDVLRFVNVSTERMRLDASGNLMLGATTASGAFYIQNSTNPALRMGYGGANALHELTWDSGDFVISADRGNAVASNLIFRNDGSERARIDASGFTQFSSNLVMPYQGAPTSKAAAATLTGAELITGILNTTGTTYTITLPTGTNIEGALTWSANNVSLDWYVINTASGTITIGANGNTTLGSLTIATGTSAHFRIRRTAANTFTVYRL